MQASEEQIEKLAEILRIHVADVAPLRQESAEHVDALLHGIMTARRVHEEELQESMEKAASFLPAILRKKLMKRMKG